MRGTFQTCLKQFSQRQRLGLQFSIDASASPLSGVRILDMSRVLAGPFASMVLGDLGAEVIKIEKPGQGDDTRQWGPPFVEGGSKESAYFLSINRNKKSVCVDINTEQGRQIIEELAVKSDVLLENFLPGKMDKKGLGYSHLSQLAPGLVYCSITGFGPDGPYSNRGGYDVIAASMGGLMHVTGEPDGSPMKVGVAMTDIATGLYAHGAIMAALIQRGRTGRGQKIDCSLLSTQVSAMVNLASNYLLAGVIPGRCGTGHASIVPYQTFPTADGYFTIGCGNDTHFRELCKRLGMEDLADNEQYKKNEDRVRNREPLVRVLSGVLSQHSNSYWSSQFQSVAFPYGPVNNMQAVFSDPQVVHNQLEKTVEHSSLGRIKQVGPAVKFSQSDNRIRLPPPTLGQHTDSVLAQLLAYSPQKIAEYRERGYIQ